MRWIDRGPEPDGVAGYAQRYTQGWVDHFPNKNGKSVGSRPDDRLWSVFRPGLGDRSNNNCWYCERRCDAEAEVVGRAPTIDHFRPISRCPQLAYVWSNWVFICYSCNSENKKNKWPASGYVDPCAADVMERPEHYFDYDANTGDIIPKNGISGIARRKASDTINDLGLNRLDVRFYRFDWIRKFQSDLLSLPTADRQAFVDYITSQSVEYAGTSTMLADQLRATGHIPA